MFRSAAVIALSGWALAACSPVFNWREVRALPAGLKAALPCKPDKGARDVSMAGRDVSLQVLGCDTGGATFALMFADIGDAGRTGEVLALWKAASLANLRSTAARETPFVPAGAPALRESVQVVASGARADGSPVESQAAYFARGSHVFQAVIYADRVKPEMSESFFAGLAFE